MKNWLTVRNSVEPDTTEVLMYGPITSEGDWFTGQSGTISQLEESLSKIPRSNRLLVGINSPGGDVFAGIPIHNILRRWEGGVTTRIDGRADSIASVIFLAGDKRICPPTGSALIHQVWTGAVGNADQLESTAKELRVLDQQLAELYAERSSVTVEKAKSLMESSERLPSSRLMELGMATQVEEFSNQASSDDGALASQYLRVFGMAPSWTQSRGTDAAQQPEEPMNTTTPAAPAAPQASAQSPADLAAVIAALNNINARLDSLSAPPQNGAPPASPGSASDLGNPLLEKYRAMRPGAARLNLAVENFDTLSPLWRKANPQGANTVSSSLYPNIAIDASVEVVRNKLFMLDATSKAFSLDVMKPLVPIVIKSNTAGPTVQTNATDFTAGNSTLAPVTVTPARITATVHITDAQANNGFSVRDLAYQQAGNFADAIQDVVTALMLTGTFGTAYTVGVAANFDQTDLSQVLAGAKNYRKKILLLDGGHLAYLKPTDRNSFALGEQGAYGFDSIIPNSRWTGATSNTCGFVTDYGSIVTAAGTSVEQPSKFFENITTVQAENGLPVRLWVWFDPNTQIMYSMLDTMFGAAVADASGADLLVTS
jgi:ATP-dependent protease ClpP protease subunit